MYVPEFDTTSIPYRLLGVSALERFFDLPLGNPVTVETTAGVVEIAAAFDSLEFPGLPGWDARFRSADRDVLLHSVERFHRGAPRAESGELWTRQGLNHPLMNLSYDPQRRAFADPTAQYQYLREARTRLGSRRDRRRVDPAEVEPVEVPGLDAIEAAVLSARFPLIPEGYPATVPVWTPVPDLPVTWHRILLERILSGRFAWRGMDILHRSGYLADVLPELAPMDATDHSKEGHPEGNVWRHSLETLRYRKTPDLLVSLALILHDAGKPYAEAEGHRKFNRHADIGADLARKLLHRLEFDPEMVTAAVWLVRYHMIPGALEDLPDHRRDPIMDSELFPQLLELYRCDLSSTFRGPDGYYRACRVYRRYLKRSRRQKTERSVKRLVELYVE